VGFAEMKKWLKKKIVESGIIRRCSPLLPTGAVILRYHSVQKDPRSVADTIGTGITHSAALFQRQIEHVARFYQPVSLDDIFEALSGGKALPPRPVAVTFDDGFRDNAEVAAPVLDRFGIPAAFYVTAGALQTDRAPWYIRLRKAFYCTRVDQWDCSDSGETFTLVSQAEREAGLVAACGYCARLAGEDQHQAVAAIEEALRVSSFSPVLPLMMDWQQVKKLHDHGHTIGSHTVTHPNMAYVKKQDLIAELLQSRKMLEAELQAPVYHFSYPSPMLDPHWTVETVLATKKAGYKTATTCTSGNVRFGDNPLSLKRMWVPFDMEEFSWYLDNLLIGRKL
jgi:peptidoglycan/xylan/chitin deacetylase (PgdA/CDA1 family)